MSALTAEPSKAFDGNVFLGDFNLEMRPALIRLPCSGQSESAIAGWSYELAGFVTLACEVPVACPVRGGGGCHRGRAPRDDVDSRWEAGRAGRARIRGCLVVV